MARINGKRQGTGDDDWFGKAGCRRTAAGEKCSKSLKREADAGFQAALLLGCWHRGKKPGSRLSSMRVLKYRCLNTSVRASTTYYVLQLT
ncbi:hypothetical protein IAQ61_008448 [Plenodomus lingam]|uniref:uncharacterized protein n=1 Tax=Leptosphaeria maculans TaxID=5022 RepID=UPI00333237A3|nr:hypothetical protein IAQ61_008448 [Plenodomus lingam]